MGRQPYLGEGGIYLEIMTLMLICGSKPKRLLLLAEMKLPGEAWLEFRIDSEGILTQTATFRPKGLNGRLYLYAVSPLHHFIFEGMLRRIAGKA